MNVTPHKVRIRAIITKHDLELRQKTVKEAVVVEVGEGCEVEVGDKVIITPTAYTTFTDDEAVVDEGRILGIIEEKL